MSILSTLLERAWLWYFRGLGEFVVDNDAHWWSRGQWQFGKKCWPLFSRLLFQVSFTELSWFPWTESRINITAPHCNFKNLDKGLLYYHWNICVIWLENISSLQPRVPLGYTAEGWWWQWRKMPSGDFRICNKMSFSFFVLIIIYQGNSTKLYLSVLVKSHFCVLTY